MARRESLQKGGMIAVTHFRLYVLRAILSITRVIRTAALIDPWRDPATLETPPWRRR